MDRPLYAYEYARAAYEDVVAVLRADAATLLQDATSASQEHADEVVTRLRVPVGGFELGRDVRIHVGDFETPEPLRTRVGLSWQATDVAGLFPAVDASLEVAALSEHPPRTQITLVGTYEPPLGIVGAAVDRALLHRVAESAVHTFVREVTARLTERARATVSTG